MIEEIVLSYLAGKLSVPVYMETPENAPAAYVLIDKTGGGMRDQIWTATFAVQSIASTLHAAALMCDEVISAMLAIVNAEDISRCEFNSSYNFTDTRTKAYRYQAVFDLVY